MTLWEPIVEGVKFFIFGVLVFLNISALSFLTSELDPTRTHCPLCIVITYCIHVSLHFQFSAHSQREQHSNRVPDWHCSEERLLSSFDRWAGLGQDHHDQLPHEEVLYWDSRDDVLHLFINNNTSIISGQILIINGEKMKLLRLKN